MSSTIRHNGTSVKTQASYIIKILLLACAYFIAGRLALLLAIPPGFASPVWPAAGIALAGILICGYKYLPAIFLGSLSVNLYAASQSGADITSLTQGFIASGIALGASLQALAGSYIIKRTTILPTMLSSFSSVAAVFIYGGFIACLVNAIIGPSVLLAFGMVSFDIYSLSVFTWWIGDIIGVVLFTPILLIVANNAVSSTRKIIITLPLIICTIITVFVFTNAKEDWFKDKQNAFNATSREIATALDKEIGIYLNILTAIGQYISASENITALEFKDFTGKFIENNPSIRSLQWASKVPQGRRAKFESDIRAQGYPDFIIKDRISAGYIEPSPQRRIHFPITYLVPYQGNEAAHGYDIYGPDMLTNHRRRDLLNLAKDTAEAQATGRISLVQDEGRYGLVIYHPIYDRGLKGVSVRALRKHHIGYASGVFTMPTMLEHIAAKAHDLGIDIALYDIEKQKRTLLYDARTTNHQEARKPQEIENGALRHSIKLHLAGRVWEMHFIQQSRMIVSDQNWRLWYLLIGGLFFSAAIGGFIILLSAKTEIIEQESKERDHNPIVVIGFSIGAALIIVAISFALWMFYKTQEDKLINEIIKKQASLISSRITEEVNLTVFALERMAQRWEMRKSTPKEEWFADARQIVDDFPALTAIEWVDNRYHVRWVEPLEGNEKALNLNIAYSKERQEVLERAVKGKNLTITPPLDLVQGYRAFIAYVPIKKADTSFEGLIVGIYDLSKLLKKILLFENQNDFHINIMDGDRLVFEDDNVSAKTKIKAPTHIISLFDRTWTLTLTPTQRFIGQNTSSLSNIAFMSSLLFALMVGFSTYTAIISNRRSVMLKSSEARLNLILDNAGSGIFGLDLNGDISFVNKATLAILGYTAEEMIGAPLDELIQHKAATNPPSMTNNSYIRDAYQSGRSHTKADEVFWHKDGHSIAVEYTSAPALDPYGRTTGAVVVFNDITERKQADDALKQANAELEEFAYRTSHDLRSPIVSSISLIQMIKKSTPDDTAHTTIKSIGHIENSLIKLDSLIKDILSLTQTKNAEEEDAPIDINVLIDQSLNNLAHMDNFSRLDIRKDLRFNASLKMKRTRIKLIVENLISNAIKYQDIAEDTPYITIRTYTQDERFFLEVEDNGLGIDKEQHDKMFQMFKRFHPRTSFGSGLGLYMMKKSADILGGDIVHIDKPKGAIFQFSAPL